MLGVSSSLQAVFKTMNVHLAKECCPRVEQSVLVSTFR